MTQRRERNAALKAGLSATLSALALIVLLPIDGSSAQAGVRPRRTTASSRPGEPSARRTTLASAAPLRLARGTPPRSSQRVRRGLSPHPTSPSRLHGRSLLLRHLHELLQQHGPGVDIDQPALRDRRRCRLDLARRAALGRALLGSRPCLEKAGGAVHHAGKVTSA